MGKRARGGEWKKSFLASKLFSEESTFFATSNIYSRGRSTQKGVLYISAINKKLDALLFDEVAAKPTRQNVYNAYFMT